MTMRFEMFLAIAMMVTPMIIMTTLDGDCC